MSKFKEAASYTGDGKLAYSLMPFNFRKVADNDYLIVTLAGDFIQISFDELQALANKELAPGSDLYKNLRSKGFLFDSLSKYSIELAAIRLRTRMAHVFHLTSLHMFVISLRCDHSCPYCQVSRQNQTANRIFDMTESIADKALNVVFDSPSKNIKIEFQGGEPLLNFDLVKHIVIRANQINETKRRNLDFVIATNLSQLDDEVLEFCREYSVHISTSLDGPRDLHNSNRPRPDKDSYERTIEGIRRCREYLGRDQVSALMTTSPSSLTQFREIIDEYLRQGFGGVFLRPISPYGYAVKTKWAEKYSMPQWLAAYKDALSYIFEINQGGQRFVEFYTALIVKRILRAGYTGYVDLQHPTGAGLSALLYNYDGRVYSSDEGRMLAEMGDRSMCIGDLNEDSFSDIITSDRLIEQVDQSFGYTASRCEQCAYLPFCGSEPTRHHAMQGDLMGNKMYSTFCERQMGVIDHVFELLRNDDSRHILEEWAFDSA